MSKTLRLLRCAVRLVTTATVGNWTGYDEVCAEIDAIHAEGD